MFNIALYQPDIPQNTAAIIRLCACFNTTLEIIEPCGFHIDDKRIKRIAMDYLNKNQNSNEENLDYNKDYSVEEYEKILERYNDRTDFPNIN